MDVLTASAISIRNCSGVVMIISLMAFLFYRRQDMICTVEDNLLPTGYTELHRNTVVLYKLSALYGHSVGLIGMIGVVGVRRYHKAALDGRMQVFVQQGRSVFQVQ